MFSAMGTHALIAVLAKMCFTAKGAWESPHVRQLLIDSVAMVLGRCLFNENYANSLTHCLLQWGSQITLTAIPTATNFPAR